LGANQAVQVPQDREIPTVQRFARMVHSLSLLLDVYPSPYPTVEISKQIALHESTNLEGTVNACPHSIVGLMGKTVLTNMLSTIQPKVPMQGLEI
jgi:hypothetical protein